MKNTKKHAYTPTTLKELLNMYPISQARAFELSQVHRTTWKRWVSGQSQPPAATLELLRVAALGDLGLFDPTFSGWRAVNGVIVDDNGMEHSRDDLRRLWLFRQSFYELQDIRQNFVLQSKLI